MSTYVKEPGEWRESWENFQPKEVSCSHCGELKIHEDIMDLLQEGRGVLGQLSLNSAYRCSTHNAAVSKTGANGPHTTGKAVDIAVRDSQHRKQLIEYFAPKVQGLGIAKSFIHIDILYEEDGFEMRPNSWGY